MSAPTERAQESAELRRIADAVKAMCPAGVGFALFVFVATEDGLSIHYIATADRNDVVKLLSDWIKRQEGGNRLIVGAKEAPDEKDVRVGLENRCAAIGRRMGSTGASLALFLFEYGSYGNLAWWSNDPLAKDAIGVWLKRVRAEFLRVVPSGGEGSS